MKVKYEEIKQSKVDLIIELNHVTKKYLDLCLGGGKQTKTQKTTTKIN